jgi:hypothetical protein
MPDQVREIASHKAGFEERASQSVRGEFGITVPFSRSFQANCHVTTQMARTDPELVSDRHSLAAQ